jgi:hypothetical protein
MNCHCRVKQDIKRISNNFHNIQENRVKNRSKSVSNLCPYEIAQQLKYLNVLLSSVLNIKTPESTKIYILKLSLNIIFVPVSS